MFGKLLPKMFIDTCNYIGFMLVYKKLSAFVKENQFFDPKYHNRKLNCANVALTYPFQHESDMQEVCICCKYTSPVPAQSLKCLQNDTFCNV
jgi:hypothetical protein